MIILSDKELEKKNTNNLLFIKRKLNPIIQGIDYCFDCKEYKQYCGHPSEINLWEKEHIDYFDRIKKILKTREHVERNKDKGKRKVK